MSAFTLLLRVNGNKVLYGGSVKRIDHILLDGIFKHASATFTNKNYDTNTILSSYKIRLKPNTRSRNNNNWTEMICYLHQLKHDYTNIHDEYDGHSIH